jgi:predicted phosphate transport protein (TIGR00153 family)
MRRFLPREVHLFDHFEQQGRLIVTASGLLHGLVHDFSAVKEKAAAIKDVEHEADRITHEIVRRLNMTYVTPIDRDDAYGLASRLDDVLDFIDAAATALVTYRVRRPTSESRAMAEVIVATAAATESAVRCLRRFDPRFFEHAVEIHRHENRADTLLRESVGALFVDAADPVEVLKWKEIYETMEGVTDRCEDVANTLQAILLKMR